MGFFSEIRSALNEIFAEFSQDVENRGDNPFFSLINRVTISPQRGTPMRILKRAFWVQAKAMENNIKRILSKRGIYYLNAY